MTRILKPLLPLLLGTTVLTACATTGPGYDNPSALADLSGEGLLQIGAGDGQ